MIILKKIFRYFFIFSVIFIIAVALKTFADFNSPYDDLLKANLGATTTQVLDRNGIPLSVTYHNRWNSYDILKLHEIPELLQQAFIISEDKRFYSHCGVDWLARFSALFHKLIDKNASRGASTITEQVIRMLHPRPRSHWNKWVEGFEAMALEMKISKPEILEFYLNQVPYASNRRGIVQGAKFYFNRDVTTLNPKEIFTLVVLVRSPSKYDLYRNDIDINGAVSRLAEQLKDKGFISHNQVNDFDKYDLQLDTSNLSVDAFQFIDYVRSNLDGQTPYMNKIQTTLDSTLQQKVMKLINYRLQNLKNRNVNNAAVLVIDHTNNEILAWVSTGRDCKKNKNTAGCMLDMVTIPRQPGSSMKPFLYSAALEKGWSPATMIDDSPYSDNIGNGIHHFHNYSRTNYGLVTLRQALGNSLNIPALHTIDYVGANNYLRILHKLGFKSLNREADFYDDGLALGSGEVTLLELVTAYSTLANEGIYQPLKISLFHNNNQNKKHIFSDEATSLIGNILSDSWARNLEFSENSVLNFPVQTAVKTGTSTDYRDAWAVGYNSKYLVGIWMGNVDQKPTDGLTGSTGPALTLRSIFNELNRNYETKPLYLSPELVKKDICINAKDLLEDKKDCSTHTEYFMPYNKKAQHVTPNIFKKPEILRPADGLQMAIDPRIPLEKQYFEMTIGNIGNADEIKWIINGKFYKKTNEPKLLWHSKRGKHTIKATLLKNGVKTSETLQNNFLVK
jgi:penicillin-binding protein 1C